MYLVNYCGFILYYRVNIFIVNIYLLYIVNINWYISFIASTAISQKTEGAPITYLNRGQSYSIHLNDRFCEDNIIHSQFIITFHDPSHQKIAVNYWRFWISQQKDSQNARAVDIGM